MIKWKKPGYLLLFVFTLTGCSSLTTRGLHLVTPDFSISDYPRTFLEVSSLTPKFQWESITDYLRRKGQTKNDSVNITKVLYDIKIYPFHQWQPGDVNQIEGEYEKFNLSATSHTLEQPLRPGELYVVMVRGFYQVGKEQRLVPWSKLRGSYSEWEHLLSLQAALLVRHPLGVGSYPYIFKTPANHRQ